MKNEKTKVLVMNAMIACIYAVFTVMISPLAYGSVQMRFSEILIFLAFYNKKYIPGLVVGCFLANLNSSLGMYDLIFGVAATLIVVIAINKVNNKFVAAFIGGLVNGILVGIELHLALDLPLVINAVYVFIGEFIVLVIGAFIFKYLEKNETFMNKVVNI